MATLFVFPSTGHDRVPDMVSIHVDSRLAMQPDGVLIHPTKEIRRNIKIIGISSFLPKSDYDAVYVFVAFACTGEVL